jgi:hypothetical protein
MGPQGAIISAFPTCRLVSLPLPSFVGRVTIRSMSATARFPRRFRFLRLLQFSLILGAIYDIGFAGLMIGAPWVAQRVFGLPLPGESFYLWLIAVFLGMLAALYLAAAWDVRRYSAIIAVAIAGRLLGALIFLIAASGRPDLTGLYPLALADGVFAVCHGLFWGAIR